MSKKDIYGVFEFGPECTALVSDLYEDEDAAFGALDEVAKEDNKKTKEIYGDDEPVLGFYVKRGKVYKRRLYTLKVIQQTLITSKSK